MSLRDTASAILKENIATHFLEPKCHPCPGHTHCHFRINQFHVEDHEAQPLPEGLNSVQSVLEWPKSVGVKLSKSAQIGEMSRWQPCGKRGTRLRVGLGTPFQVRSSQNFPQRISNHQFSSYFVVVLSGERGRNRTYNLVIKSHLLCQLSYAPVRMVGRRMTGMRYENYLSQNIALHPPLILIPSRPSSQT